MTLTATPPAPLAPPARAAASDPQADRVVLLPTAYTHPAGTFFFSSYEIVLLQVGYAFTDDTQISLSAVPPLGAERIAFLDLTLKTSLVRRGLVRAAALGSASGAVGNDIGLLFLGRAGAVVQLCLQASCESTLAVSSNVVFAGPVLLMANGVGGIWRVGNSVSLLGELATLVPIGREGGQFNGGTLNGGLRFHFASWGFDLTLVRPLARAPTIPFVAVTYRTAP